MDLHTNDSSESAAGVFVSDKCQIPVGGIPQQEPDRQQYYMALCRQKVQEISDKLGRPLTCFISTFGCQMNAHDSEKLLGILLEAGFVEGTSEESDFVLYNTCTVRENANLRVYGRLGYLHSLKKKNPHMMIALCGCMMQEPEVVEKLKKSYRFVDLIFGTHNVYKLAELLEQRFETGKMVIDIWKGTDKIVEDLPSERKYTFKSGVNIMFGCNNFCSYCIVPYVRGRERSRAPEDIIREIEELVKNGVVEIMLLGQNVNSYGKNLESPITFAELLRRVERIEGLKRIRFMTSHPKDLSDELIEVMASSKKICRHLHLPLQSGSSEILKKMNRHYTKEQYLELAERIRKAVPDISLNDGYHRWISGRDGGRFRGDTGGCAESPLRQRIYLYLFEAHRNSGGSDGKSGSRRSCQRTFRPSARRGTGDFRTGLWTRCPYGSGGSGGGTGQSRGGTGNRPYVQ